VQVLDVETGGQLPALKGHGARLITGSRDYTVKAWDLRSLRRPASAAGGIPRPAAFK